MNAVDTNVYVYALDADEPAKQVKAQALLDQLVVSPADTVLLWQVAAELLACLRKWEASGRITSADAQADFQDMLGMFVLRIPSARVFELSFDLRSRHSLSHWDSMLLAAAREAGVDTLYSEDMSTGTCYDGVTIVNPVA